MTRTTRLFRLLDLLAGGTPWSTDRLCTLLDVPARTLRRDIAELREVGYDIVGVPGPGGHYRLSADSRLHGAPPPVRPTRHGTATDATWAGSPATSDAVEVDTRVPGVPDSRLAVLTAAAEEHHEVTFTHRGRDATSARTVEPVRLVLLDGRWYLHGWDRDRRDWRTFRIDRIDDVTVTGNRFIPAPLPGKDATGLLRERFRGRRTVEVVLDLSADPVTAAARLHRVDGTLEALEGGRGTRYTALVDSYEWLLTVLLLSDVDFTVVRPAGFRSAVAAVAERFGRAL
ncbi:helix-turn-helix transcriptional regulator [Corynebacterium neomassiliense]|uniref:helix-turn-helix transcriptional regulator n=1 Tax=Corynebacterium neomassiliense TaxID=2079482 RepID=UPI0013872D11|nr:WYL domain-containing protein [Corynebacterium neomassiliense]